MGNLVEYPWKSVCHSTIRTHLESMRNQRQRIWNAVDLMESKGKPYGMHYDPYGIGLDPLGFKNLWVQQSRYGDMESMGIIMKTIGKS